MSKAITRKYFKQRYRADQEEIIRI
jgi:hypothetical protein